MCKTWCKKTFYRSSREKIAGLGFLELKDPGAVLELIAVMELGVVRGSIDPHFVNDFEPAVAESTHGIGVTLILLAMMLVVNVGPGKTGQTLLSKKMDGVTEVFVTSPAFITVAAFSRTLSDRGSSTKALQILRIAAESLAVVANLGE